MADPCGEVLSVIQDWEDGLGSEIDSQCVLFVCGRPTGHDPPCRATGVSESGGAIHATWSITWMKE